MTDDLDNIAEDIADKISRKVIAQTVGVRVTAVSNAIKRRRFPSSWYIAIKQLCSEANISCPPEAFGMVAASPNVELRGECQGSGSLESR